MANDFIIDLETLSSRSNAIVVDFSVLIFNNDPQNPQTFDQLVAKGRRWKLCLKTQFAQGRHKNPKTVAWWKEQSPEARKGLLPTDADVTIEQAMPEILQYLKDNGVNFWKSKGWCRGQSFDFPIFTDMLYQVYGEDLEGIEPIGFWNQRDIRTAIETILLTPGLTMTPLRKGLLDGFVAHNSVHDCAKDAMMLTYAYRYAMGLEEAPEGDDIDPQTVKQRR